MINVRLSDKAKNIKLGQYMHYKNIPVTVNGIAFHSETLEEMVVYTHANADGDMMTFVRPIDMFLENVVVDGKEVPRFRYLG
jgi:hypothetical protein